MDFVVGLPKSLQGYDSVWVIVDQVTKSAHFLRVKVNYPLNKLAELFIQEIVGLHGVPSSIVSDRDPKFTSHFWESLQIAIGSNIQHSLSSSNKWTI